MNASARRRRDHGSAPACGCWQPAKSPVAATPRRARQLERIGLGRPGQRANRCPRSPWLGNRRRSSSTSAAARELIRCSNGRPGNGRSTALPARISRISSTCVPPRATAGCQCHAPPAQSADGLTPPTRRRLRRRGVLANEAAHESLRRSLPRWHPLPGFQRGLNRVRIGRNNCPPDQGTPSRRKILPSQWYAGRRAPKPAANGVP